MVPLALNLARALRADCSFTFIAMTSGLVTFPVALLWAAGMGHKTHYLSSERKCRMYGMTRGMWNLFMGVTGLEEAVRHPALGLMLAIGMALTVFWMVQFSPKFSLSMGRTFGGLSIALIKMTIAIGIALGIFNMISTGMLAGTLGHIPLIGTFLANTAGWLLGAIVSVVLAIAIGTFLIKNVGNLLTHITGTTKGSATDWKAEKDTGFHGVKWTYVIAGNLLIAWLICHPAWNSHVLYMPAMLSGLLGIIALARAITTGQTGIPYVTTASRDHGESEYEGPRKSDGAWRCLNKGYLVLLDENGKPRRNKAGYIIAKVVRCMGPQGNDSDGKPHNGWNPKEATKCLCPDCDYPNPYWQICQKCGFGRVDGKGFPREPDKRALCPNCGHKHPPLPKFLGFSKPASDEPKGSEEPELEVKPEPEEPEPTS